MTLSTRPVSWIKALREFERPPEEAQLNVLNALLIAADGGFAEIAKPMHGMGSGVLETVLPFRATPTA